MRDGINGPSSLGIGEFVLQCVLHMPAASKNENSFPAQHNEICGGACRHHPKFDWHVKQTNSNVDEPINGERSNLTTKFPNASTGSTFVLLISNCDHFSTNAEMTVSYDC